MTKLTNGVQFHNESFPADFAEYLIANKYQVENEKTAIKFNNDRIILYVRNDHIDLFIYEPTQPVSSAVDWKFRQSHTGISELNIFTWIMLMHVMGVVKITEFLQNSHDESHQHLVEAGQIVKDLLC